MVLTRRLRSKLSLQQKPTEYQTNMDGTITFLARVNSFEGVKSADVYILTKWQYYDDWIMKEINKRLLLSPVLYKIGIKQNSWQRDDDGRYCTLFYFVTNWGPFMKRTYPTNNGVRIHFVTIGEGPKWIIMLHGFPDFWYTWRNQILIALTPNYQVATIDLRGYNLSDKPQGGEYYLMRHLVSDIQVVMRYLEKDKSIIVGHD